MTREQLIHLLAQRLQSGLHHVPDQGIVDLRVAMDQDVAERDDLAARTSGSGLARTSEANLVNLRVRYSFVASRAAKECNQLLKS